MPVEPSGSISLALANLRTLVANAQSWQAWTESGDEAAAGDRVHLVELPPPDDGQRTYTVEQLQTLRPYAVVDQFDPGRPVAGVYQSDRIALGAFSDAGKLELTFFDDIPEESRDNAAEAKIAFLSRVGAVIDEMKSLGGGETDYLSIHRIEQWAAVKRADETELETYGDYYQVKFVISWGA